MEDRRLTNFIDRQIELEVFRSQIRKSKVENKQKDAEGLLMSSLTLSSKEEEGIV